MPVENASWIWPGTRFVDLVCRFAQFKRVFELTAEEARSARALVSADRLYRLYLNGVHVASGPARGFQNQWHYDVVDLSAYAREGVNHIAAEVYQPGVNTFSYRHEGSAGFIASVEAGEREIVTDSDWHCRFSPGRRKDAAIMSIQLGHQEHIDAREDDRSWMLTRTLDASFGRPHTAVFGSMPWPYMAKSPLPMLSGEKVDADPAFSCDTPLYTECLSLTNATHSFIHATEGAVYGRADEARLVSGKDTARVLVMDLGRVCVGRVELSFSGALGDEVVDVVYCEVVDESGKPKVYLGETSIASRVILRPGDQTVTIMQKMGFRYAALCLYGKGDLRAAVTVFEEIYPLDVTGGLMCSDPQINDILAMCERTQRICSLDGYVDTPWREQGQWWGDARIQFKNTLAIARELKLFSFGTAQTGYVQIGNGLTYGLSPSRAHTCILPDFTLQWLLGIVELCRARGDMKPFERHYKGIKRALAYFGESAPKIGALLAHDKRYWLFLDWANIDRSGAPAVYNLWWLLTLRNVSILARASGHEKFAVRLEENASALHAEIMRALFDEEQGLLCDGLDAEGNRLPTCGVHAQTLAILCGVAGEHHADMLEKRLLPFLRGERQPDQPSTYWTAYVHEAALHYGYRREVIDHILREWTPMLADGSCHELAGVRDGRNSISHAWSAHPLHILPLALFGVDPLAGADSLAHIAPWFDERLSFARLARPWKNGTLVCAWRRNGSEIALEIECPEGLTLIVELQEGARVVTHNSRITLSGGHE